MIYEERSQYYSYWVKLQNIAPSRKYKLFIGVLRQPATRHVWRSVERLYLDRRSLKAVGKPTSRIQQLLHKIGYLTLFSSLFFTRKKKSCRNVLIIFCGENTPRKTKRGKWINFNKTSAVFAKPSTLGWFYNLGNTSAKSKLCILLMITFWANWFRKESSSKHFRSISRRRTFNSSAIWKWLSYTKYQICWPITSSSRVGWGVGVRWGEVSRSYFFPILFFKSPHFSDFCFFQAVFCIKQI